MKNTLDTSIPQHLLDNEWIITNGIGGYASSSVSGANTRRYHGLLVASMHPPTDRRVLVSKVEERVLVDGIYYDLSVNQYPEVIYPKGYHYLKTFERKPLPLWHYTHETWALDKTVFMDHGSNTTAVEYSNKGSQPIQLEIHPLLCNKDYHGIYKEDTAANFYYEENSKRIKVYSNYGSEPYYMATSNGSFTEARAWYKDFQLARDKYRGQQHAEDFYRIGYYTSTLQPGEKVSIIFSTEENKVSQDATTIQTTFLNHIESVTNKKTKDTFYNDLLVAGDQFVVKRASTNSYTILAGYHWFTDWGRDTMIAMRGLTIATGKQKASKSILSTFFKYIDKGMLPNRFPDYDGQEIEYNTIDATLWLFVALYDYYQKFGDKAFIKQHIVALQHIIEAHIKGTRYNIHVTPEGFLYGGQEGVQLTWMDAIADGHVMTPRMGCPVEINALWYNALCVYDYLVAEVKQKEAGNFKSYKNLIQTNFKAYFLNESGYLNDVIIPNQQIDASFKPNQLYALSLPFRLLSVAQEKEILKQAKNKLLTGYGLRTLDTEHPNFEPVYSGNKWKRDVAYHQGTVWTFIIPEYYEAYLRLNKYSDKAKHEVKKELEILKTHFYDADCLHGISEIFDGLNPKDGRGTIHQAWSVSAIIKLYTDYELYAIK